MPRMYTLEWYLSIRRPAPKAEIVDWATKRVLSNYFIYQTDGKKKKGICTACKKKSTPERVRKNQYLVCPVCGVRIKAQEKSVDGGFYEHQFVGYLENYGKFLLHRIFRVYRSVKPNGQDKMIQIEEAQMQVLAFPLITYPSGVVRGFERETAYGNSNDFTNYGWAFHSHKESWERRTLGGFGFNIFQVVKRTYPHNLKFALRGTPFEYSHLWELAERGERFNIKCALLRYANTPQLEYLIKLKMYKLAVGLIKGDVWFGSSEEQNIVKFLKLSSAQQMQFVIDNDLRGCDFEIYRDIVRRNIKIDQTSFSLFRAMKHRGNEVDIILEHMSPQRFYEYYQMQTIAHGKVSFYNFTMDYVEHLNNLRKLQLNSRDTMYSKPKDFYTLHYRLAEEIALKNDKPLWAKATRILKGEKSFEFKKDGMMVVIPKSAGEIFLEGKRQNHCVAGYIRRVAEKTCIIAFVRDCENPDEPFYTMEIDPKSLSIVQCRGYKNRKTTQKVRDFLSAYRLNILDKKKSDLEEKKRRTQQKIAQEERISV